MWEEKYVSSLQNLPVVLDTISLYYVLRLHDLFKQKHRASQSKPSVMRLKLQEKSHCRRFTLTHSIFVFETIEQTLYIIRTNCI